MLNKVSYWFALLVLLQTAARGQTLSVSARPTTYASIAGSVTFTVSLGYPGQPGALGFEIGGVPPGWTFGTVGGVNPPQIVPGPGATARFEFAYTNVPASPADFTFTANHPAALTGDQVFANISGIIRSGSGNPTVTAPNIILTPAATGSGVAPAIAVQPANVSVVAGANATFSVTATGTAPLLYQWRKDGVAVAGATSATLNLAGVGANAAGQYTVAVSNAAGSILSSAASLVVTTLPPAGTLPQITTQPVAQTVLAGANVSFTVAATSSTPIIAYQWRRDGVALANATAATLTLANVQVAQAGRYSVIVTNGAGGTLSAEALLTVNVPATVSSFFGSLGGSGGSFALHVRSDRTAVFLAYAREMRVALFAREFVLTADNRFSFAAMAAPATATAARVVGVAGPVTVALNSSYVIEGRLETDGSVSGVISDLGLALSAPRPLSGATSALAGFFQAGPAGSSAVSYTVLGAAGEAFVLTLTGMTGDGGRGAVNAGGAVDVTTENGARVLGTVSGPTATLLLNVTQPGGSSVTFVGANNENRSDVERLINISTRSQAGGATGVLIAGFVITGDQPKPVLVRGVGPGLASFGVPGVLAAARLQIFQGETVIATGDDWGAAANAGEIAATALRVGAFALASGSRDAALLVTLAPGAYTAIVSGQGGASGNGLIEVYDATAGAIPRGQRLVNISTRAIAGSADNPLIAGFVIHGTVPKRVLVRAAGPALAAFGVPGALARPQLTIHGAGGPLTQNAGWSTSGDVTAIARAATEVGAFAFVTGSADAAIVINLSPGAYTAQVAAPAGSSGTALIEVYETR